MISILLVVLTVGCLVTGFLYVLRTRELTVARNERDEFHQMAIESAREAERALTETLYVKTTLAQVLQRPAQAIVTEDALHQFAAVIESIFRDPERMN